MKVAFTIPDTTVDIAVAMIRAQVEDANPQEKQAVETAIEAAKGVDCVQLDSVEVFDDQQTVVLISLALAAVSNYLK